MASLYECAVSLVSDTDIECEMSDPFVAAELQTIAVIVPGKGAARRDLVLNYQLEIASITPPSINQDVAINSSYLREIIGANLCRYVCITMSKRQKRRDSTKNVPNT